MAANGFVTQRETQWRRKDGTSIDVVTLMDGTLDVESTKGTGSTFTVTLPLA